MENEPNFQHLLIWGQGILKWHQNIAYSKPNSSTWGFKWI